MVKDLKNGQCVRADKYLVEWMNKLLKKTKAKDQEKAKEIMAIIV
jgi:hypothetical protein